MVKVNDFVMKYYGIKCDFITLDEFEQLKKDNDIPEWDYPLEEYDHITDIKREDGSNFIPVEFKDDVRFCEINE